MGESESHGRLINPCFFQLQKLELELKCPACLNLLRCPVLLPCDHIFCSSCITASTGCGLACPICKLSLLTQDLRVASHMETIINIYKSMSAVFSGNFCPPRLQVDLSEIKKSAIKHQDMCNTNDAGKSQENDAQNICRQKTSSTRVEAFAEQEGPCSPPSSGALKYSDDDSNDRGSVLSGKSLLASGSCKNGSEAEDHIRDLKRQKLNADFCKDVTRSDMDDKSNDFGCQRASMDVPLFSSQSGYEGAMNLTPSNMSDKDTSDPGFPCEFCHSSKESKGSGPMVHYADGEPVDAEEARSSNVLHVHQKCIEWSPKVYFVGDTAKNLEAEISRAAKMKCSRCGKKGAALGCYAKSCRKSFHIPCAFEIPDCRWDCDNYLILCPAHSSRKLPSDRSSTGKNVRNLSPVSSKVGCTKSSDDCTTVKRHAYELWMAPPEATNGWVLCGSALSVAEKDLVAKFARLTGAVVTKDWRPDVTHVFASTDPYGACSRTLKFLMAILNGKWILKIDWIKACMEAKHPVAEENYEISHDIHGCFDGPRNGRIRVMEQEPKLFSGLGFYFSGDFVPTYKGYLEDLISAAGGNVLQQSADRSHSTGLVVYSLDPPLEGGSTGNKNAIELRLQEAKAIATKIGAQVIGHTWVLDSIAACKMLPLLS